MATARFTSTSICSTFFVSSPVDVSWVDLGVEVVLECTGKFLTPETPQGHLGRGAKRAIVASPVKVGEVLNEHRGRERVPVPTGTPPYRDGCFMHHPLPRAVVKVVHEALGFRHGQITTIHDATNTSPVVDAPHKDLRRARSAMLSLAPTNHRQRHRHRADLP